MGMLAAIIRRTQLKKEINNCENKQMSVSRDMTNLSSKILDYQMMQSSNLEADSAEAKEFESRIQRLKQVEEYLQELMNKIQNQIKIMEAEYQSTQEMFQSSLQRFYN